MKYVIGTGFFNKKGELMSEFHRTWYRNTLKYSTPCAVYTVACAGSVPPPETAENGKWLFIGGDVGHVGLLLSGVKNFAFTGWTMTVLTLALIAYQDEADFIFKEQDCLAFGDWVKRIYAEAGTKQVVFGNYSVMGCAQSLFMVRHAFIPEFVEMMLHDGDERKPRNMGEKKFLRFEKERPDKFGRFSFGYDRERPFNVKDDVFYVQQLTGAEMNVLVDAGLVEGQKLPAESLLSRHGQM